MYGFLCGFGMSLWVMIEFLLGFHTTSFEIGQYSGFFSMIIPAVFVYIALTELQTQSNGFLSVTKGIDIGFNIALVSGIIFTIFLYFYNNHINPDWVERLFEWQRKNLILSGANDHEVGKFISQHRYRNSSLTQSIITLVEATGVGVFFTIIEIGILKSFSKRRN